MDAGREVDYEIQTARALLDKGALNHCGVV